MVQESLLFFLHSCRGAREPSQIVFDYNIYKNELQRRITLMQEKANEAEFREFTSGGGGGGKDEGGERKVESESAGGRKERGC
jgi:hypothetical protein